MKTRALALLICALGLHVVLGVRAALLETPTVDEYAHLPAGLTYWEHGTFPLYAKNPPLIKLWASAPLTGLSVPRPEVPPFGWGPWLYGMQFEKMNADDYLHAFHLARFMILTLSVATGLLIFAWLKSEPFTAAAAAAGFWFAPTVLAHAHLATIDVGAAFTIFLFAFCWRRGRPLATGVTLGLALATKFTAVFLIPLVFFPARAKNIAVAIAAALLTLFAAYGFTNPPVTLGGYAFKSRAFAKVAAHLPEWTPVPFPRDWVAGFDAQVGDTETGEFGNYLLGEFSDRGWWYYNLVALAFKEHVLTLLLLVASAFFVRDPRAWVPAALIGVPMLFFNPLQVGVRYLLPLFPFFFVWIGHVLRAIRRPRVVIAIVLAWAVSAVWSSPEHLGYFNFASRAFGQPEDLLLDSNLDWGQDLYRVPTDTPVYLTYFGHVSPLLYGIRYELVPPTPVKGLIIVSANFWKGMSYVTPAPDGSMRNVGRADLEWLRALKPTRRAGALVIFDNR